MTMGSSDGGENGFVALVKPFFEALGEQNRYVQTGSALCLTRVIDEAREPPISLLAQMLTRVVKLLKNQHFMAKPAVIELIRSIVQVIAELWVFSILGSCFNFLSLFYLAFVLLHTVRILYEKYEDKIDSFGEKAIAEIKKQYAVFDAKVLSKVPKGPLKDMKH